MPKWRANECADYLAEVAPVGNDHLSGLTRRCGGGFDLVVGMRLTIRDEVEDLIADLLSGAIAAPEFDTRFSDALDSRLKIAGTTPSEEEYYGMIQEKLSWVGDDLSDEERTLGWINESEFLDWLRERQ